MQRITSEAERAFEELDAAALASRSNGTLDGSSKDAVVQSVTDTDGQKRLPVQSAQPFEWFLSWLRAHRAMCKAQKENANEEDKDWYDGRATCAGEILAQFSVTFKTEIAAASTKRDIDRAD